VLLLNIPGLTGYRKTKSFDYDLNIFKIVSIKTEATVQWQDLSIIKESSLSLHKFLGLENEVWPGCLVYEIQALPNPNKNSTEALAIALSFDPKKSKVNSRERLASVDPIIT
jgi:ubiquitin-conjugating enzyme E2 O